MNTITYKALIAPIIRPNGEPLDNLRINIDYQKGGINYFTGNYCDSGVYVYFTPCIVGNGFISTTISGNTHIDGYKILLKPIGRKSQKQIEIMAGKILPHAQEIARMYSEAKHSEIYDYVKMLVNYT